MVLWCYVLAFKNFFKLMLLKFKNCNVRDITSRTMFCCHYLETVSVYERLPFTKVFLLEIKLCGKNVFKIFHVVILGKKKRLLKCCGRYVTYATKLIFAISIFWKSSEWSLYHLCISNEELFLIQVLFAVKKINAHFGDPPWIHVCRERAGIYFSVNFNLSTM